MKSGFIKLWYFTEITEKFKNRLSLEESDDLINISENSFTQGLRKSLSELKKVREYSYKYRYVIQPFFDSAIPFFIRRCVIFGILIVYFFQKRTQSKVTKQADYVTPEIFKTENYLSTKHSRKQQKHTKRSKRCNCKTYRKVYLTTKWHEK
jgi:hypothetical protein